jgi:hypothetical protein
MSARGRSHRRRMRLASSRWRFLPLVIVLAVVLASAVAYTASNTFTSGGATGVLSQAIAITDVTPATCKSHGINPTTIVAYYGGAWHTVRGGGSSQLWLGTAAADTINAGTGNDCLVPGAVPAGRTDTEAGQGGTDDCLNGPGPGTYSRNGTCEYTDSYPYTS